MHYNEILREHKIGFPLVHSEANFRHPLAYGDTVDCTITVPKLEKLQSLGELNLEIKTELFVGLQIKLLYV